MCVHVRMCIKWKVQKEPYANVSKLLLLLLFFTCIFKKIVSIVIAAPSWVTYLRWNVFSSFLGHIVSVMLFILSSFLLTELWTHFLPESITSGSGKQFKLGVVGGVWTFVGEIRMSCIGHAVQGPWSNELCMAAITFEHLPSFFPSSRNAKIEVNNRRLHLIPIAWSTVLGLTIWKWNLKTGHKKKF